MTTTTTLSNRLLLFSHGCCHKNHSHITTTTTTCPCANVRRSCCALFDHDLDWTQGGPRHVRIDDEALSRLAHRILNHPRHERQPPTQDEHVDHRHADHQTSMLTTWDEHEWHYTGTNYRSTQNQDNPTAMPQQQFQQQQEQRRERVALYILALDAINFCFWPTTMTNDSHGGGAESTTRNTRSSLPPIPNQSGTCYSSNWIEYEHLAIILKFMAQRDDTADDYENETMNDNNTIGKPSIQRSSRKFAFSPYRLATITVEEMIWEFQNAWNQICLNRTINQTHDDNIKAATSSSPPPVSSQFLLHNMKERCRLWNELGIVLETQFHGSATYFLQQGLSFWWSSTLSAQSQLDAPADVSSSSSSSSSLLPVTACGLVDWLIRHLSGFRDETVDDQGRWIGFYKRAQICVADLHGALDLNELLPQPTTGTITSTSLSTSSATTAVVSSHPSTSWNDATYHNQTNHPNHMRVLDALTCFADYRVPQYLRHVQVLEYSPTLAKRIDQEKELNDHGGCGFVDNDSRIGGSCETSARMQELYIRAATVVVVQRLVEKCRMLQRQHIMPTMDEDNTRSNVESAISATSVGRATAAATTTNTLITPTQEKLSAAALDSFSEFHINDVIIDWYLWQLGEGMTSTMKPHHRVRTLFY